ncbi:uncharacterized protein LOC114256940 [Camellia sinensis]|uniref:uncharacterized protein LOC114256940 n=1 Tax=Camellia sinensis TaxID=4442 RepID=UPI00103587DD|nr:uncharacterized protein LOC114256940 [Camellia sinensis]
MGHEQAIYYLSRRLNDAETRYNSVEKMCLALYFAAIKLRHYMLPAKVYVVAQTDVIKYMLSKPILRGRQDLYEVNVVENEPWKLMFDGSKIDEGVGAGVVLIAPNKQMHQFAYQLEAQHIQSCNQAEYEALIIGLELTIEFKIRSVQVFGDSQLVIKQVLEEFKCVNGVLGEYLTEVKWLISFFDHVTFTHRYRLENRKANEMAQAASGLKKPKGAQERVIQIKRRSFSALRDKCRNFLPILTLDVIEEDWRFPLIKYLSNPSEKSDRQIRYQALNYVIMGEDLFRKAHNGLTLLCIGKLDQMKAMAEAHEEICGAHQAGDKMRWLINKFGLPQSITVDQGTMFNGDEIKGFATEYGIQILNSSPYYAQANGQAKATNKIVKNTLERMIEDNPRDWHNLLSEVLRAYRNSKRNSTGTTPYELVYGHDVVLPLEATVRSNRLARHLNIPMDEYAEAISIELQDLEEKRIMAFNHLIAQKKKVERSYNKKVKSKAFSEGELVWKTIIPIGLKSPEYGKWSPNWEGPFNIHKVLKGGAYHLVSIEGEPRRRVINGKYLKKYYPIMWECMNRP